jgi:hypothetical protein
MERAAHMIQMSGISRYRRIELGKLRLDLLLGNKIARTMPSCVWAKSLNSTWTNLHSHVLVFPFVTILCLPMNEDRTPPIMWHLRICDFKPRLGVRYSNL